MRLEEFAAEVLQARVPAGSQVFRLAKFKTTFDPAAADRTPGLSEFSPTKADAEEAERNGWPLASVSLWDLARTTVEVQTEAASERDVSRAGDDPLKQAAAAQAVRVAYLADVAAVHALTSKDGSPAFLVIHAGADAGPDPLAHVALFGLPCKHPPRVRRGAELEEDRLRLLRLFQRELAAAPGG